MVGTNTMFQTEHRLENSGQYYDEFKNTESIRRIFQGSYWKFNFPYEPYVRQLVGRSVIIS